MNLYKISQAVNEDYDTYDSAIVAAETEEQARLTYPGTSFRYTWDGRGWVNERGITDEYTWCDPKHVVVELIGTTHLPAGVVLASFNAG